MAVRATRWLATRMGRRGATLAILGAIFVLVGVDVLLAAPAPDHDRFLLHTFLPGWIMAALWIVPGAVALRASLHKGPGRDGFGFMALVVPLILRIVSYLVSFIAYLTGEGSWPYGWASALLWVAILALILVIAGWAEVPSGFAPKPRRRWK